MINIRKLNRRCEVCNIIITDKNKSGRCKKHIDFLGKNNPFYGKTHTKEVRKIISLSQTGRKQSQETIEKRRLKLIGKKHGPMSEEHKEKYRLSHLGKKLTQEHKNKIGKKSLGHIVSREARIKIGIANSRLNTPEFIRYKQKCAFKFDMGKYLNEFDINKIHNMFHPTKNKHGYTRDHIYSIYEGFKHRISIYLISHPANCRLILHSENSKKNKKSEITLFELIEKVRNWENKYGKYEGTDATKKHSYYCNKNY